MSQQGGGSDSSSDRDSVTGAATRTTTIQNGGLTITTTVETRVEHVDPSSAGARGGPTVTSSIESSSSAQAPPNAPLDQPAQTNSDTAESTNAPPTNLSPTNLSLITTDWNAATLPTLNNPDSANPPLVNATNQALINGTNSNSNSLPSIVYVLTHHRQPRDQTPVIYSIGGVYTTQARAIEALKELVRNHPPVADGGVEAWIRDHPGLDDPDGLEAEAGYKYWSVGHREYLWVQGGLMETSEGREGLSAGEGC